MASPFLPPQLPPNPFSMQSAFNSFAASAGDAAGQALGHSGLSVLLNASQSQYFGLSLSERQLLMGGQPGMSHIGTVREFRKKFKEYTKAEFREIGKTPIVKDILSGLTKLNKDQIADRIKEHLV